MPGEARRCVALAGSGQASQGCPRRPLDGGTSDPRRPSEPEDPCSLHRERRPTQQVSYNDKGQRSQTKTGLSDGGRYNG